MRFARGFLVFSYGLFTIAAQALLFREFITAFEGNDISVGIFFGCWFLWVGLGAILVYRAETFAEKVKELDADIVGASALLSTTAPYFKEVHEALKKAELRDKVHFMIGGPPLVTAEEVGADYYTNDAFEAVREALEHMRKKN